MTEQANTKVRLDVSTGHLSGQEVLTSTKYLNDLEGVFQDEKARAAMNPETKVYEVQAFQPVKEGTSGGLFFGNSTVYPGKVANEYFMTRGHFHQIPDTAEFYWCIKGEGILLMMNAQREIVSEGMKPGSLHYIPGLVAHRVVNTGDEALIFNACWPSDAGHDYQFISDHGFAARVFSIDGKPHIIKDAE